MCTCEGCRYLDENETWGGKCYCEWLKSYVDTDDGKECSHYDD